MDEFTCAMNNGFHKQMGERSMCYKYDVLKEVCIYVTGEYNQLTEKFNWSYVSGCYEQGKHELFENL